MSCGEHNQTVRHTSIISYFHYCTCASGSLRNEIAKVIHHCHFKFVYFTYGMSVFYWLTVVFMACIHINK